MPSKRGSSLSLKTSSRSRRFSTVACTDASIFMLASPPNCTRPCGISYVLLFFVAFTSESASTCASPARVTSALSCVTFPNAMSAIENPLTLPSPVTFGSFIFGPTATFTSAMPAIDVPASGVMSARSTCAFGTSTRRSLWNPRSTNPPSTCVRPVSPRAFLNCTESGRTARCAESLASLNPMTRCRAGSFSHRSNTAKLRVVVVKSPSSLSGESDPPKFGMWMSTTSQATCGWSATPSARMSSAKSIESMSADAPSVIASGSTCTPFSRTVPPASLTIVLELRTTLFAIAISASTESAKWNCSTRTSPAVILPVTSGSCMPGARRTSASIPAQPPMLGVFAKREAIAIGARART